MPNQDYHYGQYGQPTQINTQSINGAQMPQWPGAGGALGGPMPPQPIGGDPGTPPAQGGYANPYDPRIGNGALPPGISGTQDRAYTGQLTPDMFVENRLNSMLDSNSLYMRIAAQRGRDAASASGLGNSSIAAGSAQRAAIESALPVVSQDANALNAMMTTNLGHLNERQIADLQNQVEGARIAAQLEGIGLEQAGALQRQRENLAYEGEQRGLDRDWTNARDYWTSRYQTNAAIQEYGARTRIDLQAQPARFFQYLSQMAAENPDIYTPEVVGGIMNTIYPVYEDMGNEFDMWFDDAWGGW